MKCKTVVNGQQGFLMLEIIVTLVLLSALVGIVGIFYKQPLLVGSMSSRYTVAANLAQQAIESLKADEPAFWQAVNEKTDIDFSKHSHSIIDRQIVNEVEYILQGTVEPHSTVAGIVVLTITVSYMENGNLRSLQYETYFTKYAY